MLGFKGQGSSLICCLLILHHGFFLIEAKSFLHDNNNHQQTSTLNYQPENQQIQASRRLYRLNSGLGSRPPRCINKCKGCHPCQAVEVPAIPQTARKRGTEARTQDYSNYKPLSWKCKCRGRLYNP